MSTLETNELAGIRAGNHVIAVDKNTTVYSPGQVIQTLWKKMDYQASYASNNSGNGTPIDGLDISITLKRATSKIYCQWWVFYEGHHNVVWTVLRDTTLIGYNTDSGNSRWSGIGTQEYEHSHDQSSTPSYQHLEWIDEPGNIGPHLYRLASRGSGGSNYTTRINRPYGNTGSDNHETGVSWAMIQEIAV